MKRFLFASILAALACQTASAQWLPISNASAKLENSEMGGPFFKIASVAALWSPRPTQSAPHRRATASRSSSKSVA